MCARPGISRRDDERMQTRDKRDRGAALDPERRYEAANSNDIKSLSSSGAAEEVRERLHAKSQKADSPDRATRNVSMTGSKDSRVHKRRHAISFLGQAQRNSFRETSVHYPMNETYSGVTGPTCMCVEGLLPQHIRNLISR